MTNNRITNVNVWGLEESVIASGLPMTWGQQEEDRLLEKADEKRAVKLGSVPSGTGHDCFLKGIIVQFDWRIPQVIFPQVERYHFIDIVSSQSKMHRIHTASRNDFHEKVDPMILDRFLEMVRDYNEEDDPNIKKLRGQELFYSVPMGYELTARFTTNYLQLKTIYKQRKNHKLKEWQEFCQWVKLLPYFRELTGVD